MDRATLVDYRIDDGRLLRDRLIRDGLDVSTAFWMYDHDEEKWGLYLISRGLTSVGIKNSYLKVILAIKGLPGLRIDPLEVTMLDPSKPLATAIVPVGRRASIGSDPWIEKTTRHGIYVEMAYVYPSSLSVDRLQETVPH